MGECMLNLMNIVKKEFQDLISSRMVLVVLSGYFLLVSFQIYYTFTVYSGGQGSQLPYGDNAGLALANWLLSVLAVYFGPILGIMIGCTSVANERHKNTLNTLLVKPVFRDTIINGKIVGSMIFLSVIIAASIAFYTSCLFVLCGGLIASTFYDYFSRLPFVFILSLLLISVFLVGSMLISLVVKDQTFALILGTVLVYLSLYLNTADFVLSVASLFPEYGRTIIDISMNFTPAGLLESVRDYLFMKPGGFIDTLLSILPDVLKFVFLFLILSICCYVIFIRSDVA